MIHRCLYGCLLSGVLALSACDSGKARMAAPPSEAPDPILVPPASLDGVGAPGIQLNNQAAAILIDDAVAITEESTPSSRTPARSSAATATATTSSAAHFFHVCRAGDVITALAQQHGVDADALARINGVAKTAALPAGSILVLPRPLDNVAAAPDVATYTVVAGDTYSKIARTHKISFTALMYLNKAKSSSLQVGDVVYVPKLPR